MLRQIAPFLLTAALAPAQFFPLEISEVLIRPRAGNHQIVELSTSNAPISLNGHFLVVGSVPVALPNITVPAYTATQLHLGESGISGTGHIYLPTAPAMGLSDSIALFRSNQFANASELLGYVGWGGALGPQIALAVQAGQWNDVNASAALPALIGSTLANRRYARNTGNLVGPGAWFDDSTPTLGAENDPGWTAWYAIGCPDPNGPNIGMPMPEDTGPWIGEPASIVVTEVPLLAILVLGLSSTPPVDLTSAGMPGCFANVTFDTTVVLPAAGSYATYQYTVPRNPGFVGLSLHMQALVPDASVGNALQARVTIAIRATVGSR